jgi:hypothetical protein
VNTQASLARGLAAALLLSSFTACGGTYVVVKRRIPAEVTIRADRSMAVAGIVGPTGAALAAELSEAIMATQRYALVERQRLDAVLREIKLSADGHVSDATAMTFGEMTGAATLVAGDVFAADYHEHVVRDETKCAKDGKLVVCSSYVRSARAAMNVSLRVIETESGRLLAIKQLEAAAELRAQAYDTPPPPFDASSAMLATCRKDVASQFAKVIAPHDVEELVHLFDDGDLPELERGNNFARLGSWDQAEAQYNAALSRAKSAGMKPALVALATYDLGVAVGYGGDLDGGLALVEGAYALDPRDVYLERVTRLRQMKVDAALVKEQEQGR